MVYIKMKRDYINERRLLISKLIKSGILKTKSYVNVMLKVPRHLFVWPGYEDYAYVDHALPLGDTGQTISAPHMCAYILEELRPNVGDYILEIGAGSGYQAALLAETIAPTGHVVTIEIVDELVQFARKNLEKAGYEDNVTVIRGDGTLGYPPLYEKEIYDKILVTAAAPYVPKMLIKQLKVGGRIVIPIGNLYVQTLTIIEKLEDKIVKRESIGCMFVPLRGANGWKTRKPL